MARELLVLRHAKSDWTAGLEDVQRPLSKRGCHDAPRMGAWLYREGLMPDYVISSPAERARQTAVKVCKGLEFRKKRIVWEPALYEAGLSELLAVLAACPETAATVLLVGHNPGLEALVGYLAGDDLDRPADGKLLPTAAVARFEMPPDWHGLTAGNARLLAIKRPRDL